MILSGSGSIYTQQVQHELAWLVDGETTALQKRSDDVLLVVGPVSQMRVILFASTITPESHPFAEDLSKGILGGDRDVYYPKWFLGEWEATWAL